MTKAFVSVSWPVWCLAALLNFAPAANGTQAAAWHIPDGDTNFGGLPMRNPEFEIGTNTPVTIWSGVWKWSNGGSTENCNQTGGWVIYKGATQSSWSSNALTWQDNFQYSTGNQYWNAPFNTTNFGPDEVIQYYLLLTFDTSDGITDTNLYLYAGGDYGSLTTTAATVAAASPFTVRNRPAWLFHANNRVVTANPDGTTSTVSFWTQIGYQSKDAILRWANNGCIYYTTDGSTPSGSLGVGSHTTRVMPMIYDHEQDNSSIAGNAMWWVGTVTNLPEYSNINYQIGFWNSANDEEKFADYNAGAPNTVFTFSTGQTGGTNGVPTLTVDGMNAEYTTEHLFVDEVAGDAIPVTVLFSPNTNAAIAEADVYSNLNRRNNVTLSYTNSTYPFGTEEGIVPPDGSTILAGDDSHYYKAYVMNGAGNGQYSLTLYATNCGAYRLTARFRLAGSTNWIWYGLRDHCIVVTPPRARDMTLYEMNAMILGAQSTNESDRGTFADLDGGPGARPYDPVTNRFNLQYFQNLGVNWLWLQPVHPIGIVNRQTDPNTGEPYAVGSPYSVQNYFQINPLLSKAGTRDGGMEEFTNFVAACNSNHLNVMMDIPLAHSSWDCELDNDGTNYFAPAGSPTDIIMNDEARFYSRTNEYDQRAYSAGSVAPSPDRYDFGKWTDVAHIYSGRYAALVPNASQEDYYLSEADWFDYSIGDESGTGPGNGHFDQITQNVWRYYSDILLYWLDKTGCPSNTPPAQTCVHGIGGLRADFGQGLAPQCWEYIINKVRCQKWDFVFMTESLDGGVVTYRSNRHFDVLNENLIFALQSAATASDYRSAFDARRTDYGQSVILLNNDSHDEESFSDPFEALIRYMACGALDGAPMIFYGEELGISTDFGFDEYQLNFGKTIPNFMVFNDLQPICTNPANGVDYLWPDYAAVNEARQFSVALKSSNRYYLNQIGSETTQPNIFSVAKFQTANASPNFSDVVFAFTPLDRNNPQIGNFDVNITQNGSNLFGIQPGRIYNVKNIAAHLGSDPNRRNYWLWPTNTGGGYYGSNILSGGVYVSLNPVPTTDAGWSTAPFEVQYLKLYDVTPPPAPSAPGIGSTNNYVFGNSVTFTWPPVSDAEGGVSGYHVLVGTTPGGSDVTNVTINATSLTVTGYFGAHLYATVTAVNNANIESLPGTSSGIALVNPAWVPVANMPSPNLLGWTSVSGLTYQVWSTTNLSVPFTAFSGMLTAAAPALTFTNHSTNAAQFFKIRLLP
jgi:glycosidase